MITQLLGPVNGQPNQSGSPTHTHTTRHGTSGRAVDRRVPVRVCGGGVRGRNGWPAGAQISLNHASTSHPRMELSPSPTTTHHWATGADERAPPPTWTRCQPRPATRRTRTTTGVSAPASAVQRTWRTTCRALRRRLLNRPGSERSRETAVRLSVPATAMKPRPLDYGCGPAAAAAAGCAGWAWRPRPRGGGRSPGVSPKCSNSPNSAAAAGAVHSEHHRRGDSVVLLRPVELPGTGYGSEVEARIERVIFACRFMTFLGIGGLLLGSVPCFLKVFSRFID